MAKVTLSGHQTLLSTPWYLNRISYGQDWQGHYKADPQDFKGLSSWLIYISHWDWSLAIYVALFVFRICLLMFASCRFTVVLLVGLRLYILTLDTDLKCHEDVCHSGANMCKPVE